MLASCSAFTAEAISSPSVSFIPLIPTPARPIQRTESSVILRALPRRVISITSDLPSVRIALTSLSPSLSLIPIIPLVFAFWNSDERTFLTIPFAVVMNRY